jgi:Holliday junction resolvase RusA-like endonuclease
MTFFVAGTPKATPRVKACRFGQGSRVYTPKTADDWKYCVQQAALKEKSIFFGDRTPFAEGPVELELNFFLARPKSHFNKKGLKPKAPTYSESKPDNDNLMKCIMDALTNASLWRDDAQVAVSIVRKQYMTDSADSIQRQGCRISINSLE